MAEATGISWCDSTWNPVTGCSVVSPGCVNCYAAELSTRYGRTTKPWTAQNAAENVVLHPDRLNWPRRKGYGEKIFTCSMSDLFHELVPDDFLNQVFEVMESMPWKQFQILTKRPERAQSYLIRRTLGTMTGDVVPMEGPGGPWQYFQSMDRYAAPNIWLGTSVEDQRRANERLPILLETPTRIRFVSAEPLLEAVDLRRFFWEEAASNDFGTYARLASNRLHWIIAGAESGPNRRPYDEAWARSILLQCRDAGVAFWYKQGSAFKPGQHATINGMEYHEFPTYEKHRPLEQEALA